MATSHGQPGLNVPGADDMEVSSDAGRRAQDEDDDLIDYSDDEEDTRHTVDLLARDNDDMMEGESEALQKDHAMREYDDHEEVPSPHDEELRDFSVEDDVPDGEDIDLVQFDEEPPQSVDLLLSDTQSDTRVDASGDMSAQPAELSLEAPVEKAQESHEDAVQDQKVEHSKDPHTNHEHHADVTSPENHPAEHPSGVDDAEEHDYFEDYHDYGDEEPHAEPDSKDYSEGSQPNLNDPAQEREEQGQEDDHIGRSEPSAHIEDEVPHGTLHEASPASTKTYEHACQLVIYGDDRFFDLEEQFLFPTVVDHTVNEGFLDDVKLFKKPLKMLLDGCREKLHMDNLDMFQLVLTFESLSLRIGEDSTSASTCCLENVVDVYTALWHNQGALSPDALYVGVTAEHSFYKQFDQLRMSSNEGKSFAEVTQTDQDHVEEDAVTGDAIDSAEQDHDDGIAASKNGLDESEARVEAGAQGEDFLDFASNAEADDGNDPDYEPDNDEGSELYQTTYESQEGFNDGATAALNDSALQEAHVNTEADSAANPAFDEHYPYEDPDDANAGGATESLVDNVDAHNTKTELAKKSPVEAQTSHGAATDLADKSAASSKLPISFDDELEVDFSDDGADTVTGPHHISASEGVNNSAHADDFEANSRGKKDVALTIPTEAPLPKNKEALTPEEILRNEELEFWADFEKRNSDQGVSATDGKVSTPVEAVSRRVSYDAEDDLIDYSDDEDDSQVQKKDAAPQESFATAAEDDSTQENLSRKRALDQVVESNESVDDIASAKKVRSQ